MGLALEKFVQNYYERNGSFENINLCKVYDHIQDYAEQHNESVEDALFDMLGYKPFNNQNSSAIAIKHRELISEIYTNNRPSEALKDKKLRESFKKVGIESPGKSVIWVKRKASSFERSAKVLAAYFDSSDEIAILDKENNFHNLNEVIAERRIAKKSISANVNYILSNYSGISIDVVKHDNSIYVANGKLYTCEKIKNNSKLVKDALHIALSPVDLSYEMNASLICPSFHLNPDERSSKYLALLDYLHTIGITYKELLEKYHLNVPDYENVYATFGYIPVIFGDTVALYKDDTDFPAFMTMDEFVQTHIASLADSSSVSELSIF